MANDTSHAINGIEVGIVDDTRLAVHDIARAFHIKCDARDSNFLRCRRFHRQHGAPVAQQTSWRSSELMVFELLLIDLKNDFRALGAGRLSYPDGCSLVVSDVPACLL